MPPEELPQRPEQGRAPHPRRPASIDGFSPATPRRPITPMPGGQRPVYTARPVPLTPLPPIHSPQPAPQPAPPQPNPVMPRQPQLQQHVPPVQQFRPPKPKRRWRILILKVILALVALLLLVGGILYGLSWKARQNDPELAFREALTHSLSVTQVQADVDAPASSSKVIYDFAKADEPQVSNQATIQLAGLDFDVKAYGSPKNTYISYTGFPNSISSSLQTSIKDSWVRLRVDGRIPTDVNAGLANLADPRYQAFGPVIFGNFPEQTRVQMISFLEANKVYKYDKTKVTKKSLEGTDTFAYPITFNVSYLKIANQSSAASEKFPPGEIQAAVDKLDQLKGASAILYVTVKDHQIRQLDIKTDDGTTTIKYSNYNKPAIPVEPQTKLTWKDFAPAQAQLEAQAKSQQTKNLTKSAN